MNQSPNLILKQLQEKNIIPTMKQNKGKFRHELKYEINNFQEMELKQRIPIVMKKDKNSSKEGSYKVISIYFDNLYDKAIKEKVSGISKREKFRIRYYDDSMDYMVLEKKMKENNLCKKISTRINKDMCMCILEGNIESLANHKDGLVMELYQKMKNELLRPKVIVTYQREAYTFPAGNVRVTFDSNIKTSAFSQNLLENELGQIKVLDTPSHTILEIKYDEFLPEIIEKIVQVAGIRQQAVSKYVAARKFG